MNSPQPIYLREVLADIMARFGSKDLSGSTDKSQETCWQNGKDIPEGKKTGLTAHASGSELSPRQTCECSVSPAQIFDSMGQPPIKFYGEEPDL